MNFGVEEIIWDVLLGLPRIMYHHAPPGPAHHTPVPGWPQLSIVGAMLGPATCRGMLGGARPAIGVQVQAAGPTAKRRAV